MDLSRIHQIILESMREAVYVRDLDMNILYINPAAEIVFGYSKDEVAGCSTEVFHVDHDHFTEFGRKIWDAFDRGEAAQLEFHAKRKNGEIFPTENTVSLLRDENGKPIGIVSVVRDITERKNAEQEALRESEERLQLALRGADLGLWDWDLRTGKATRDERAAALYGYPLPEMEASFETWESAIHPADKPEVLDKFNKHLEGSTPFYEAEYRLIGKSGETTWVLARGKVSERDRDGKPLRVVGTLLDITDRKQAEEALKKAHDELERKVRERTAKLNTSNEQLLREIAERKAAEQALRESEERYRELVENSNDIVYRLDNKGFFTFVNSVASRITGYSAEELVGLHYTELILPDYRKEAEKFYGRQFVKRVPNTYYEFPFATKNGEVVWAGQNVQPIKRDGEIVGFQSIARDITDRKRAEEEREQTLSLLRATIESTADGILVVDTEGKIALHNRLFATMWSIPDRVIASRNDDEALKFVLDQLKFPEDFLKKVRDLYGQPDAESFDVLEFKDGRIFERYSRPQRLGENIVGRVWSFRDVTKRRQAEAALLRAKMDWEQTFDAVPDLIMVLDDRHRIVRANRALANAMGVTREGAIGLTCSEAVHGQMTPPPFCPHAKLLSDGKPHSAEVFEKRLGGTFDVSVSPLLDERGDLTGSVHVAHNITQRKNMEEALRDSEENFRTFFQTMHDMIIVGTPDGRIMYTNPAMSRKLGYSLDEFKEMHVLDVHPRELRGEAERIFADLFKGEQDVCPLPLESKSGVLLPVETRVSFGKWSGLDCIFGICKDLSREQEALQKFERLFRNNPALMAVSTIPEQRFTDVNDAFLNTLGFAKEEVIGKTSEELGLFVQPEMQRAVAEDLEKQGRLSNAELKVRRKDGAILDGIFSGEVIESQGQRSFLTVMIDLTARKRAEEQLRESEEKYRSVFDNAAVGINLKLPDGTFLEVNQALADVLGYDLEELSNIFYLDITHPDDMQISKEMHAALERGDLDTYRIEKRYARKDGGVVWVDTSVRALRDALGNLHATIGITADITERKNAEEALRESEEKIRTLINAVPDIICFKDGEGRWQEANESDLKLFELEGVQYQGKKDSELAEFSEFYREAFLTCEETDEKAWVTGGVSRGDEVIPLPDGSSKVFDLIKVPLFHPDGSRKGLVVVGRDTSELRTAEELQRESDRKYRDLFEQSRDAIAIVREGGEFIDVNESFGRLLGYTKEESLRINARQVWADPADRERWQEEMARTGFVVDYEWKARKRDGTVIDCVLSSTQQRAKDGSILYQTFWRDISNLKKAQEQLGQSERFRAVADLAGGVAHNFNNLLQIVIGNLQLALMDLESGNYTNIRDSLEKVLQSSRFGAETVRRLQSFAGIRDRSQVSEKGVFDLSGVVRQALEMSKTWWKTIPEKEGIEVSLDTELQDGCLVQGERNELFEVVVNLVKNASEALPQGGTIDVKTCVEGARVVLKIRDTGIGMSEQNLKRLFNPFFTTKASAGSGFGLASSRKIIDACGGEIFAESSEGKGTTFTILLPLAELPPEQTSSPAHVSGPLMTILVIDDMEAVLDVLKAGLTRSGHVVVTASSGEQGLDIFEENPIDLVICDLGMPGINGWEVGKRIRSTCEERSIPKTPFILLTGWGGQKTEAEKIAESGVDAVVEKPINIGNVLKIIQDMAEAFLKR